MVGLLSSDITTYLETLKQIRKLPVHVQTKVYELTDIYLNERKEFDERENALYTIWETFDI